MGAVEVTDDHIDRSYLKYLNDTGSFPRNAPISTTSSTSAAGLLKELIIEQGWIAELAHLLTSQSSRLLVTRLRKFVYIGMYQDLKEASKACQQILDLCAESLEELTFCMHLLP